MVYGKLFFCLVSHFPFPFPQIQIRITDTNNKIPQVGDFAMEIKLYENATTGDEITRVSATDLDRDSKDKSIIINLLNVCLFVCFKKFKFNILQHHTILYNIASIILTFAIFKSILLLMNCWVD